MFFKRSLKFGSYDHSGAASASTSASGSGFVKSGSGVVNVSKGKRISLDDVANVAINHYQVVYDCTVESEEVFVPLKAVGVPLPSSARECFPSYICRAALFARIISLLNGPLNWRHTVIETLISCLNDDVIPRLSDMHTAGNELVAAVTGTNGATFYADGKVVFVEQLVADNEFTPIGLTIFEAQSLALSAFVATGSACLTASGAVRLSSVVDGISALSCEAFGASTEAFDATIFENFRQHRGQLNSASNLRSLLEGSMRVNNPKDQLHGRVFAVIPQSTGPAMEAITVAAK
jgi:histidine ammonia-lyase